MRRVWVVLCLVLCVGTGAVFGQTATNTPAPTSTPAETQTPTPEVHLLWILPTQVNDLGTPEPEQWVDFAYSADAGQVGIIVVLAILLVSVSAFFLIWLLTRPRGQRE